MYPFSRQGWLLISRNLGCLVCPVSVCVLTWQMIDNGSSQAHHGGAEGTCVLWSAGHPEDPHKIKPQGCFLTANNAGSQQIWPWAQLCKANSCRTASRGSVKQPLRLTKLNELQFYVGSSVNLLTYLVGTHPASGHGIIYFFLSHNQAMWFKRLRVPGWRVPSELAVDEG